MATSFDPIVSYVALLTRPGFADVAIRFCAQSRDDALAYADAWAQPVRSQHGWSVTKHIVRVFSDDEYGKYLAERSRIVQEIAERRRARNRRGRE